MSILNDVEKNSGVWLKLKAHYQEQLDICRLKNDNHQDEVQTAILRGRIAELKTLLREDSEPIKFSKSNIDIKPSA